MRVLLDYDGCIADTMTAQLRMVNDRFDTQYRPSDMTSWATETILSPEEIAYLWSEHVFLNDIFQLGVAPIPGAIAWIKDSWDRGDYLTVVSDRPRCLFEATRTWLDEHGLDFLPMIFTRHRSSRSDSDTGILTKLQALYHNRLDTVCEDAPHHASSMAVKKHVRRVYLLDKPYNQDIEHDKIIRVSGWSEIPHDIY